METKHRGSSQKKKKKKKKKKKNPRINCAIAFPPPSF
jgi:hypothetical protein